MLTEDSSSIDDLFDMYAKLLTDGFMPDSMFMAIDSLQSISPELTDEVLAREYGVIRGQHFVILSNKGIFPGTFPDVEDESEQV